MFGDCSSFLLGVRPSEREPSSDPVVGKTSSVARQEALIGSSSCESGRTDAPHQRRDKNEMLLRRFQSLALGNNAVRMPRWSRRESIVEIGVTTMENIAPQRLADRSWVGVMPVGRHPFWRVSNRLDCLQEKPLSCLHISLLARAGNQPNCHPDQSPERGNTIFHARVPVGAHRHTRRFLLAHVARARSWSANNGANRASQSASGLMGEYYASLQKHLSHIP